MAIQQANAALMQALTFTQDDLDANRQGRLSARQIAAAQAGYSQRQAAAQAAGSMTPWLTLVFVLVIIGVGGAVVATGALQTLQTALGPATIPVLAGAVVLALLYALVFVPLSHRRAVARAQALAAAPLVLPQVYTLTGPVQIKTVSGDAESFRSTAHYAVVGSQRISISAQSRKAFAKGQLYRIYFTGTAQHYRLISAEALDAAA